MKPQLQKAIEIAGQTGDRVIVVDTQAGSSYAVMSLDEYERLALKARHDASLTEDNSGDRINAISSGDCGFPQFFAEDENLEKDNFYGEYADEGFDGHSIVDDFGEIDFSSAKTKKNSRKNKKSTWNIPAERKVNAEEISDEAQYLEDIPF